MPDYRICPRCDGDGWEDEWRGLECQYCGGFGDIELEDFDDGEDDAEASIVVVPGVVSL